MQPLEKLQPSPALAKIELSRRHLQDFIAYTKHDYQFNWHHITLCDKLERFAAGEIRRLMVFMPPQHGKSQLTTRHLPAYILGKRPSAKIAVCCYSATLAQSFNRDIQRIIDDTPYHEVFPETILSESNVTTNAHGNFLRNADIFETVGHRGFVKTVGVGGSLTGTPIDIGIIDDPFKDREEAMSIRIRDKVWSWFTDVFRTRLHNDSQELVIMTRWDEDDLAGRILKSEGHLWEVVTMQAIKERETPNDPRQIGEPLWPERHSLERILSIKETSPFTFSSLYQQEPKPSSEALVFPEWDEYEEETPYTPVYGLDFGFSNDPSACVQVKIHKQDMWVREIFYKKGLTTPDLHEEMTALLPRWARIGADSADPRSIEDLKRKGWNVSPCKKGPDSIINGINWIKGFNLHVHKDSYNFKNELLNYQWLMYGGKPTNMPIDSFNHCADSIRYSKDLHKAPQTGLGMSFHR